MQAEPKKGPRAKRREEMEFRERLEREFEKTLMDRLRPSMIGNARAARSNFKRQNGR